MSANGSTEGSSFKIKKHNYNLRNNKNVDIQLVPDPGITAIEVSARNAIWRAKRVPGPEGINA